ncbi:MAG TPA: hypothetical protein VMI72_15465 [Roseiarcus sp.]|nr:hypothetical protein [Roseiarcus sp.]
MDERDSADNNWFAHYIVVQAAMFFPRDQESGEAFSDAMLGNAAKSVIDRRLHTSLQPAEAVQLLELALASLSFDGLKAKAFRTVRRNRSPRAETPQRAALAGGLAGDALLIPFICHQKYRKRSVGLHQAFRLMLKTNEIDDPRGQRNLQKVWQEYLPVVHLWAAWSLAGYESFYGQREFAGFVSLAELIRAWGEEFTPAGARSPILDRSIMAKVPETWTVPVAIDFNDFDLDDELKARLEL